MSIGVNIKTARMGKRWSQHELAERSGVCQSWISRLESGEENPTLASLTRVADALGLELPDLLREGTASEAA